MTKQSEGEKEVAIALVREYLEIIKKDNTRPTYRWNTQSHGVLGFLRWLQDHQNSNSGKVE